MLQDFLIAHMQRERIAEVLSVAQIVIVLSFNGLVFM